MELHQHQLYADQGSTELYLVYSAGNNKRYMRGIEVGLDGQTFVYFLHSQLAAERVAVKITVF